MSRRPNVVLFAGDQRWRVAVDSDAGVVLDEVEVAGKSSRQELAQELCDVLRSMGVCSGTMVVAVESQLCFSGTIDTAGLGRRGRRTAMLYRLEAKLPLEAEDLLADFAVHNGQALAVCIRVDPVRPVLDALEAAGFAIAAVVPRAVLSLQGSQTLSLADDHDPGLVLWRDGETVELFELMGRQPVRWLTLNSDAGDLSLAVAAHVLSRRAPVRLLACGRTGDLGLEDLPDVQVTAAEEFNPEQNALRAADDILAGRLTPLIDVHPSRGVLAPRALRRPLAATAAAIALCLICAIGALTWRGHRYAQVAGMAEARKQAIFQSLFPGHPVPLGVESRLRSVQRQLRGGAGMADAVTSGPDALASLLDVLTRLPLEPRSRITELDLSPGRVQIVGEVRSHADADLIASSLRRSPIIRFDDPQTQQTPHGSVELSLSGTARQTEAVRNGGIR